MRRGEHHRRPAALAVADNRRFRTVRVELAHLAHELFLCLANVEQGLARLGIAKENDEVDRVSFAQGDTNLRVVLEAADAGGHGRHAGR